MAEIETTHHHKLDHGCLEPLAGEGVSHGEVLAEDPHDKVQLVAVRNRHTDPIPAPPH